MKGDQKVHGIDERRATYLALAKSIAQWHERFTGDIDGLRRSFDAAQDKIPLPQGVVAQPWAEGTLGGQYLSGDGMTGDRVLLYLHGGGYTCGSSKAYRHLAAAIGLAAECEVLVLDYRLAPEYPFPAALEDARAAYAYLSRRFGQGRIAIAGDSAGGGLMLALLASLRDGGETLPCAGYLMSPMADLRALPLTAEQADRVTEDAEKIQRDIRTAAAHYLAGQSASLPGASPVLVGCAGFPPLMIQVGSGEVMLRDALALANASGGTDITLEIEGDAPHAWQWFCSDNPYAAAAALRGGEFLGRRFRG